MLLGHTAFDAPVLSSIAAVLRQASRTIVADELLYLPSVNSDCGQKRCISARLHLGHMLQLGTDVKHRHYAYM